MPKPAFIKIQQYITDKIDCKDYKPGDKIPTEKELAELFNVSRMTVNRAIVELSKQGVVERTAGKGTYISSGDNDTFPLSHPIDFSHEVKQRGGEHRCELLDQNQIQVFGELAVKLGIADRTKVGFCSLLNYENNIPVLIERRWINVKFMPNFMQHNFIETSPSSYLHKNFQNVTLENVIEAINPDTQTQHILDIQPSTPCLRTRRRIWSESNLISYAELIGNGFLYRIVSNYETNC